jgi:pyruvate dehydrogenase E2 component (dihydrolipoamide acetyltransferase)
MGDTMEEGTIAKWYKAVGDQVKEGEEIAEIETEKAAIAIEAFENGPLTKIIVQEGETVPVGAPIAVIGDDGGAGGPSAGAASQPSPVTAPDEAAQEPPVSPAPTGSPAAFAPAAPSTPEVTGGDRVIASPLARRIALNTGVSLQGLQGTGPNGRIVAEDVEAAAQGHGSRVAPRPAAAPASAPSAPAIPAGDVWVAGKATSQMRRVIARRLTESKQQVPHFQATMEIDMEAAMTFRAGLNARGAGFAKVGPNDLITKAVADTLRAQPAMRVAFGGDTTLSTDQVNVGVAVALPDGLIVPVIRNADQKSLNDIVVEGGALIEKARAGKLLPDDYSGGTFSVSNLGMYGVEDFIAIINPPEPGILAVGGILKKPVVANGEIVVGLRMNITLSADHRVIDGAVGAEFLQEVKRRLENPLTLER